VKAKVTWGNLGIFLFSLCFEAFSEIDEAEVQRGNISVMSESRALHFSEHVKYLRLRSKKP
jgi:hypothetical protein